MATRTISTKLVLEGEKELRSQLTNIQRDYAALDAELKKVEATYKGSANSTEALTKKGEALRGMLEKQQQKVETLTQGWEKAKKQQDDYTKETERLQKALADAEKQLDGMGDATEENAAAQQELKDRIAKLREQLEQADAGQQKAANTATEYAKRTKLAEANLELLNHELKDNDQYLDEAKASADGCATSIDEFGKKTKTSADAMSDLQTALLAAGAKEAVEGIAHALIDCAEASIEFESAITGVFKTVEGTPEQLATITDGIKDMALSIPSTTTEIAGVAEAAGQLGIATDNVVDFTEVMIGLGNATNMTAESAASDLAKFANITQMSADSYDRLGSSIVALGNNLATTEQDIVNMGMNIASAGTQCGLTQAEIMGMSGALSSLGLEAQMGGTAISRLMIEMKSVSENGRTALDVVGRTGMSLRDLQLYADASSSGFKDMAQSMGFTSKELKGFMSTAANLEKYAEIAGMTGDEFMRAFGEDAAGTMSRFFQGLGSGSESAVVILKEMGIEETRLRDTMLRLANSGDLFTDSLNLSTRAWEENSALAEEVGKRYATTESKLQITKNAVDNLKVAIGDKLSPTVGQLADAGTSAFTWMADVVENSVLLIPLITGLASAAGVLVTAFAGFTILQKIAPMLETFKIALAAHPIGIAAIAVTGLVTAFVTLAASIEDSKIKVDNFTTKAQEAADCLDGINQEFEDAEGKSTAAVGVAEQYIDRLEELEKQGLDTAESQREYKNIVDLLNQTIPDLNATINEQTGLIEGGTVALRENVEAWKEAAIAQALQKKNQDLLEQYANTAIEIEENRRNLTKAEQDGIDTVKQQNDVYQKLADTIGVSTDELDGFTGAQWQAASGKDGVSELMAEYSSLGNAVQTNAEMQGVLSESISIGEETLSTYDEELASHQELMDSVVQKTDEFSQKQGEAAGSTTAAKEEIIASCDALLESYDELYTKTAESINSQISMFEQVAIGATTSAADITAAFESQVTYFDTYAKAIDAAVANGVDQGIISNLMDGSTESLSILMGMAEASDDQITEMNNAFARANEGKNNLITEITDMKAEFTGLLDDVRTEAGKFIDDLNQYDEAYKNGELTMRGYIEGLKSLLGEVETVNREAGRKSDKGIRDDRVIESPSKKHKELGRLTMLGYVEGMKEMRASVQRVSAEIAGVGETEIGKKLARSMPTTTGLERLSSNSEKTAVIELYLDSEKVGRVVTPYVSQRIAIDSALSSRSKGGTL